MNDMSGVGVDIIRIDRLREVFAEENSTYFESVYTADEMKTIRGHADPAACCATRFAAKEAVFKALGTAWEDGMSWQQIEILSLPCGALTTRLTGAMADAATLRRINTVSVSVSWDGNYAIAFAVSNACYSNSTNG